jgi:CxxC-x17-CxxC domain-containing protein
MFQRQDSGFGGAPRQTFSPKEGVIWTCAQCGNEIKELPFPPRSDANGVPTSPIYCRDCHRARAQSAGPRRWQ